jgi:Uma2 family endonuclease
MSEAVAAKKTPTKKVKIYTLREYLAREERSLHKHEFHHGQIIRMPGAKFTHNEIATNITTALRLAVKPLPKRYRVLNSDQKIYIQSVDKALYPDALVICEQPEFWEDREDLIVNPLLIVEVASRSTGSYDRAEKFFLYELLPSFREYVIIEQGKPHVEAWFREDETTWKKAIETDLTKSIFFKSIGVSIALSDVYDNIEFKTI